MPQEKRRRWKEGNQHETLMFLWDTVGSVALIAIMMGRSRSAIQTQASRLHLAQRPEDSERHRRRWVDGEDERMDALLADLTLPDGSIPIQELADAMDRSVDAVVTRLEERHGADSDIMSRLVAPPMPVITLAPAAKEARTSWGTPIAKTNTPGQIECLKCRLHFRSAGNFNRICVKCKRADDYREYF